ncbi:ABC transporter substrate-binding protein [Paenibacillus ihumii]|uniref:ABC transporter substrate-binding protein n=1 Tax=Paenibacillus ihumii TaxID=687436 RepID=UPI0016528082|nr:extracellular solute-binding protein [Paenibacillus ihumii]
MMRALIVVMVLALLTACTGGTSNPEQWDPGKKTTLTVLTFNERLFKEQYGTPFLIKNENITLITKLPSPGEVNWGEELAEKQPDLLHITKEQYIELAEKGLLYDLEPMLKEDGWNSEGLHPAVLQLLRDHADGVMYGGTATLQSKALYYNAGLFRQFGVPLPEDQMTWEQVYDRASHFQGGSGDDPVYGYSSQDPSILDQLLQMGRSEGLTLFSPDGKQFLISSESWKTLYGLLVKALETGTVFTLPSSAYGPETQYRNHPFVMGQSAMLVGDTSYLSILDSKGSTEESRIDWGVAALPQGGQSQPGNNPEYQLYDIVAVSKEAAQPGAAKAFIQYMMSEEWARETAEANPYALLARYQLQKEGVIPERRLDPFFSLDSTARLDGGQITDEVLALIEDVVLEETERVLSGSATVEAALQEIQAKGQAILEHGSR